MSAKKGLELLKTIATYMTETQGFDRVLKHVRNICVLSSMFTTFHLKFYEFYHHFHLAQVTIVSGGDGKCLAEMKVLPEHLNRGGGLHGGLSSTIVDVSWNSMCTLNNIDLNPL